MFSVISVCSRGPRGPTGFQVNKFEQVPLPFQICSLGTPTTPDPRRDPPICSPYIYWQAGSWLFTGMSSSWR